MPSASSRYAPVQGSRGRRARHQSALLLSFLALAAAGPAWSGESWLVFETREGITIQYPRQWRAAASQRESIVALAGPQAQWGRPAAAVIITRGTGSLRELLNSAARGLGTVPPPRLLGEQRLGRDRIARYYIRTVSGMLAYTIVAVAANREWIVTIVGVDSLQDPDLPACVRLLQALVLGIAWPG